MLCDSHAHLTGEDLYPQAEEMLLRAQAAGVTRIVNVCTDASSLHRGLQLADAHSQVANIAAIHPHDADSQEADSFFLQVRQAATEGQLVGIGESGLDYHHPHASRARQQEVFTRHLALAKEKNLPIVVHCREAFTDFLSLVDRHYGQRPLLLHCFTGTVDEAQEVSKRGYLLSWSGILTFKHSEQLRMIARQIPDQQFVVETDAPYLAPHPQRGKLCEPAFVRYTAECLAKVRGVTVEEIAETTTRNLERIFTWKNADTNASLES